MTAATVQPTGIPASGDAEQEVQKRVLEGIMTMLPTLINIVGAQRKAADLDEEAPTEDSSENGDEVIDKGAFDMIRTFLPVALQIAQSARRKDVEIDDRNGGSSDPTGATGEEIQKFLPALLAIATIAPKIPGAVNAVRNLVSPPRHGGVRPRGKSVALDGSDAETQKSLQSVLSMFLAAAPHVARALKPQSTH